MLEEAIWATPTYAHSALPLWLLDPVTRDERVVKALKRDQSIAMFAPIWQYLHFCRQDLLDPFISGATIKGKFGVDSKGGWSKFTSKLTRSPGWLFPAEGHFDRWLPRQQRSLAKVLRQVANDSGHVTWSRVRAIAPLALMNVHRADDFVEFVNSSDVAICEEALRAIVWTDQPVEALPILLEHLEGDRARVAMFATSRVLQHFTTEQLLEQMRTLLRREWLKTTVLKEVIRIVGSARNEDAAALLMEIWKKPKLHRDARAATLHATRELLDYPTAWKIINESVDNADEYTAQALLGISPLNVGVDYKERYASVLLKLTENSDRQIAKKFFQAMHFQASSLRNDMKSISAGIKTAAQQQLLMMEDTIVWRSALNCLVQWYISTPNSGDEFEETFRKLVDLADQELASPADSAERDQPAIQRLTALVDRLVMNDRETCRRIYLTLLTLADKLSFQSQYAVLEAKLRLATVKPDDVAFFEQVCKVLPQESIGLGCLIEEYSAARLSDISETKDPASHIENLDLLLESGSVAARRVALSVIVKLGRQQAWTSPWKNRLQRLRQDPDIGISALACMTFTIAE